MRCSSLGLLASKARKGTFEGIVLAASSIHRAANSSEFVSSCPLREALGLLHLLMKPQHSLKLS